MGATTWRYYVSYQADTEAALQALRSDVFERGAYAQPITSLDDVLLPTVRRLGDSPGTPEEQQQVEMELRVHRAVESGDMSGLSPAIQAFANQIRALRQSMGLRGGGRSRGRSRSKRPKSIKKLLEHTGESGTHSILDIERVGDQPEFAVATPLPADEVRQSFGTDAPTREDVERSWEEVGERLGRWEAHYLVVYRDGQPHEYVFIGCSGD